MTVVQISFPRNHDFKGPFNKSNESDVKLKLPSPLRKETVAGEEIVFKTAVQDQSGRHLYI